MRHRYSEINFWSCMFESGLIPLSCLMVVDRFLFFFKTYAWLVVSSNFIIFLPPVLLKKVRNHYFSWYFIPDVPYSLYQFLLFCSLWYFFNWILNQFDWFFLIAYFILEIILNSSEFSFLLLNYIFNSFLLFHRYSFCFYKIFLQLLGI